MPKVSNCKITTYLILNVVVSLVMILLNKWIYSRVHFPNITLSFLHFVVTFIGLHLCEKLNIFNVKTVHLKEMLVLSLSFCGFVVFTNLSLENNTVGTFQVTKVLTTPGVILIQMLYYGKTFSLHVKLTLFPIVIGVILNFYYDIHFNFLGTFYALLGVVITSLYQVLVNKKQSELQINSMQLLYYQAPLSAVVLCVGIPFLEPPFETLNHHWNSIDLLLVTISCLAAFFCNLTTYWIIGNTSPLTYNMLGHSKFVLVTVLGWLLFYYNMSVNQLFGIVLTLFGIVMYTHIKNFNSFLSSMIIIALVILPLKILYSKFRLSNL